MKRLLQVSLILMPLLLTGCGGTKAGNMKTDFNEYVNIGTYKHIVEIDESDREFNKEGAMKMLEGYLDIWNQSSYETKNGIMEEGQQVNVSCKIGGETEERNIILGKEEIAQGVDEQLVGQKAGFILNTQAEGEELQVVTNYIVEKDRYEAVTDEFVEEFFDGPIHSVDDYVDYYCGEYAEDKKISYGRDALYQIVETAQFRNIEPFVEQEYKRLYKDLKDECEKQGIKEKDLYKVYGVESKELLEESLNNVAMFDVKQCLVLYKLQDMFGIKITQEDIDQYTAMYGEEQESYKTDNLEEYVLYRHILIKLYEMQL